MTSSPRDLYSQLTTQAHERGYQEGYRKGLAEGIARGRAELTEELAALSSNTKTKKYDRRSNDDIEAARKQILSLFTHNRWISIQDLKKSIHSKNIFLLRTLQREGILEKKGERQSAFYRKPVAFVGAEEHADVRC